MRFPALTPTLPGVRKVYADNERGSAQRKLSLDQGIVTSLLMFLVQLSWQLLRHALQNWWGRDGACGGEVVGIRGVRDRWRAESLELYQVLAEEEVEGPIQRDAQLFLEPGKLAQINGSPHPPG
jgi:hypothetical protein